jgi:hydroxymethylpyrimidine pyrophosphatase-like HAD family hydrolase
VNRLRCIYVDLDGTLLGHAGSLFHDGDGNVSLSGVRAVETALRAGVEMCIYSGRREAQVIDDARLIGQSSYIFEVGCAVCVDGETEYLTGDFQPREDATIYQQMIELGAPDLILDRFGDRIEYHAPWHLNREVSHLFRGNVDVDEVNSALAESDLPGLRLVDNGRIGRSLPHLGLDKVHAYHLIPSESSKARGVARHMQLRGYCAQDVIAAGDSAEDLEVASVVGHFFLMRNAVERNPDMIPSLARFDNVTVTEERNGAGVYEALVGTLALGKTGDRP